MGSDEIEHNFVDVYSSAVKRQFEDHPSARQLPLP